MQWLLGAENRASTCSRHMLSNIALRPRYTASAGVKDKKGCKQRSMCLDGPF
jgi:hypothetical protein